MSWLFPLVARLWFGAIDKSASSNESSWPDYLKLAILIPAHNEEINLERTLLNIAVAVDRLQLQRGSAQIQVTVRVGADGCTDQTVAVARRNGAVVLELQPNRGKWGTLRALLDQSGDADWVALADCGVTWPADLLARLMPNCARTEIMAVAPGYAATDGSWLERAAWGVDRPFKRIEAELGGPVSIHGATIFYRRAELVAVMEGLGADGWLNDDVVIPLMLRARFPEKRIRYLASLGVSDRLLTPVEAPLAKREFGRRRRLVIGNLQWIRSLLPEVWSRNSLAGILALRRVFRVLWAYWGICLAIGASLILGGDSFVLLGLTLVLIGAGTLALAQVRASLLAPYYLFAFGNAVAAGAKKVEWR